MVSYRKLVQALEQSYQEIYKEKFRMNEFKKLCKEKLYPFARVEIQNDTKNKLWYITFRSCTDIITETVSHKRMKDKVEMLALIERVRETLG